MRAHVEDGETAAAGRRAARLRGAVVFAALAALAGAGLGACGGDGGAGDSSRSRLARGTGLHGAVLPEARAKGDFTLTATDGESWNFRQETDGRVTLLFFGYTHCPNACPVQMATLGAAYGKLPWKLQEEIEVVFVTTDPARDTLSRLDSWLDNFDGSFVGLRGRRDEVNRIMGEYGLPPARIDTSGAAGDGYTVGHAAHVLLFTPDDSLRMMYPTGTRQRAWVEDLRTLAREGTDAVLPAGGSPPGEAAAGGG